MKNKVPQNHYGVLEIDDDASETAMRASEVIRNGYTVIENAISEPEVEKIGSAFDLVKKKYFERFKDQKLQSIDEHNTVRCPATIDPSTMFQVIENKKLLELISCLIKGRFILNQQNLIINPANKTYNQGKWHRDLPYQHLTSSTPLAVNAILCVDDFTSENGASFVLPGSHRDLAFANQHYVNKYAVQLQAPRSSMIIMDCMTYHSGAHNSSRNDRRAINQVYSIPYIKQQIDLPRALSNTKLTESQKEIIGTRLEIPTSIDQYLNRLT